MLLHLKIIPNIKFSNRISLGRDDEGHVDPPRQIACSDRLFPPGSPCWCLGRRGGLGFQKTRPGSTRSDNHDNGDEHVMV